ncbi:MAG TPA: trypsin-like peptidase domain-containing protein [Actinomycetaceae bacterium]|nr:trypsin-like peptidase domain-containing protein [Actinomycetaceae bacterium]
MRERAGLQRELEVLHSPDGRTRIVDTTLVPWRWVCHLDITYLDPGERYAEKKQAGTGVLIGPRHVLTAAHNLLSDDGRLKTQSIRVTPGRNGSRKPFGTIDAASWKTHPRWVQKGKSNRDFDYALITLDDSIGTRKFSALQNRPLGYWSDPKWGAGSALGGLAVAQLDGITVNVAGYAGDKPAGTLWSGKGTAKRATEVAGGKLRNRERVVMHDVDTGKGQSGGPMWVWYSKSGRRNLVGVHVAPAEVLAVDASGNTRRTHNLAVRISDDVIKQLNAWM